MSEMMTVEAIIEADWFLQGFWAKPRFAFQTEKGGWSDVDVLAYHPEKKHLVIAESKVHGSRNTVYAYTAKTRKKWAEILDTDLYFSFLQRVDSVCKDGIVFADFRSQVQRLTVQLVSNYFVSEALKQSAVNAVADKIRSLSKVAADISLDVRLETTMEVFCRVIKNERDSEQGKRYGHPVIDIARELNRYLQPDVRDAGNTQAAAEVQQSVVRPLWDVLNPKSPM